MSMDRFQVNNRHVRQRGSVYILVLGASLLVAAIGVSSLMAARVQRRATTASADMNKARELARAGIDLGLFQAKTQSTWRSLWAAGLIPNNMSLGGGTFSLTAVDPVDGLIANNSTDPVVLTGIGKSGSACYLLEVTLNGNGSINPSTWKRVVGAAALQAKQAAQAAQIPVN